MIVQLIALITAGVWLLGFVALAKLVYHAVTGTVAHSDKEEPHPLLVVGGICFGLGIVLLIVLYLLGYFTH